MWKWKEQDLVIHMCKRWTTAKDLDILGDVTLVSCMQKREEPYPKMMLQIPVIRIPERNRNLAPNFGS